MCRERKNRKPSAYHVGCKRLRKVVGRFRFIFIYHLSRKGVDRITFELCGTHNSIACVPQTAPVICDVQSALDLLMTARYETGCDSILLPKECLCEDFFVLRTGFAGEVLQKFVNYQMRLAIVGDFSPYTSKPLRDFMYESNQGNAVFFAATTDEAVTMLERA